MICDIFFGNCFHFLFSVIQFLFNFCFNPWRKGLHFEIWLAGLRDGASAEKKNNCTSQSAVTGEYLDYL